MSTTHYRPKYSNTISSHTTLYTVLNTSIFNMVELEVVDWEEIFQQSRVWCTFNPFIVYLFSSFTFFQQKGGLEGGLRGLKSLALVIGWLPLSPPMSILHNSIPIHNSSCKMNTTCTSRWTYLSNTWSPILPLTLIHQH